MSNKFLAEDLEEGLSKKDYTNAANNFEVEGQQEEYESLLYTKDFKSESNLNYETFSEDDFTKEKLRQEKEGYGVGNYFVDDSNQNINQFFRFSLDLVEIGFEFVNGEIAGISDVANKMLWGKSIDPEKAKVLEKAYNENRYKMGGMEDTENTETIDLNAVDRMKGVSVNFKEWKNSQEEKLINNFIESSTRQQVYMQDKSKAQKIGLLGISILNNAFLDPNNIFFGGFGSKALIRIPLAEYVYNMSDVYDRNIADYTLDDAKNIATMYAVGKTIGFTMNAPRMIKGAYDSYKQDIFDTARDFEAYKQSKGFEEYDKTQEENKSYKYHRNGKVFDNAEIPAKYYDEQTSPKTYLDNLKTEDREQVVADMKYLLPYNEDNLKNKNDYIFITSDDNLYSKIPKENIPDNKIEQTEEKINVNDLTQFKKQLRKISPDFIIKKSVSSNSIYVDLYNEGKVVLSGRISDHNKSFQSEGEISVILGEKEGIEYKKINSKDFSKKIKEYGYNEFLDKLSNFVKENNVKFSSNKTVDYITFSEVLDLSTKGKISKEIRDKALSNEIDIKSLPKKKMIKYLKELSNNNKIIEKEQVDILFNYIDKNPDLESFNPITNYANIFKKGDIDKRIDLALNEGVIESDINLKDELQYRKENSILLSPVTTHKGKEEILNYFDDILYSKLKESGIQANDRILSFKDFKEVVNKFDLAFKGNNPTVKQLKFMLDNKEIEEFYYNERWNIENPLKKISDEEISMETKNINEDNIESSIDYKAIPKNKEYLLDYMQGVFELANKELESTIGKNIPFVRNVFNINEIAETSYISKLSTEDVNKFIDSYKKIQQLLEKDYNKKTEEIINFKYNINDVNNRIIKDMENFNVDDTTRKKVLHKFKPTTNYAFEKAYTFLMKDSTTKKIINTLDKKGLIIAEGVINEEGSEGIGGLFNSRINSIVLNNNSNYLREVAPQFEAIKPYLTYLNSQTYAAVLLHEVGHAFEHLIVGNKFFESIEGTRFMRDFGHSSFNSFILSDDYVRLFSMYPIDSAKSGKDVAYKEAFAELFEKAFSPMTINYSDKEKNLLNTFRNMMLKKIDKNKKFKVKVNLDNDSIETTNLIKAFNVNAIKNEVLSTAEINYNFEMFGNKNGDKLTIDYLKENLFDVETNNKERPFEDAIWIFNAGNEILKYDGEYDYFKGKKQGGRANDHSDLWYLLDEDTNLEDFMDSLPITFITPERKIVTVSKKQLPFLAETLFKNFPPSKWEYEELKEKKGQGNLTYDPVKYMSEYHDIMNTDYYTVNESVNLYSRIPNGEEKGDLGLTIENTIENLEYLFKLEQQSKLRTEKFLKDDEGKIKVVYQADDYNTKALNTAKDDTVISILTPTRNELLKNAKQNIHTVKSMLWKDTKHRTLLSDIDLIAKEFNNNDLIYGIKHNTGINSLAINSKLNNNFVGNLRKLFEENVKFKSKEYDTEIEDEIMGIDTFYYKNIVQSLLKEKNEDFIQNVLKPNLKDEMQIFIDNPQIAQLKEFRDIVKSMFSEISDNMDFIDIMYIILSKTNRDNNATPLKHSEIADILFKDREAYENIYTGYEKELEAWLPQMLEGSIKNISNYRILDEIKRVTSEKWTNNKKTIQIASKSDSIQNLVDNELSFIKGEVDKFISNNIKAKNFITKDDEKIISELEFSNDKGIQKLLNDMQIARIKSGMQGVYNPFVSNILSYKYLTSLNFWNEGTINKRAVMSGLERYGLVTPQQYFFNGVISGVEYFKMVKEIMTLTKHLKNIENFDLDKIENGEDKLLITTWLNNEIANDLSLDGTTAAFKLTKFLSQGAKGQSYSDVHRKTMANWELYNIFAKGLPIKRDNERILGTLKNQGISEEYFKEIQQHLKTMDKNRLFDILFNSKITNNDLENHIVILFKTIVEHSGENFDPLSRETQKMGAFGNAPIIKYLLMYKRYAISQASNLLRMAGTKMTEEGLIADKQLFKKLTSEDVIRGSFRFAGDLMYFLERNLGTLGTALITAYLVGDEQKKARSKAILDDLFDLTVNGNMNSMRSVADMTVSSILENYGVSQTMGAGIPVMDMMTKPYRRFETGLKQEVGTQDIIYGVTMATAMPEVVSRAYDTITLGKDFAPSIPFSSSKNANKYYKRYLREAKRIQRRESTPQGLIPLAIISPFMLLRVPSFIKEKLKDDKRISTEITQIYNNEVSKDVKDEIAFSVIDTTLKAKRTEAVLLLEEDELKKQGISYEQELKLLSSDMKKRYNKYIKYKGLDEKESHLILLHLNDIKEEKEQIKFMQETMPTEDRNLLD